jgi:ribosomal protein S18 acetylase RimI-like enzyme
MRIRTITPNDLEHHKALLFVAFWTPDNEEDYTTEILQSSTAKEFYQYWGKKGDIGFFALDQTAKPVGFIQVRHKSAVVSTYSELPEMAISVVKAFRGNSISKQLFSTLIDHLGAVQGIRLKVHPMNQIAISLYRSLGFKEFHIAENGFIHMVWLTPTSHNLSKA